MIYDTLDCFFAENYSLCSFCFHCFLYLSFITIVTNIPGESSRQLACVTDKMSLYFTLLVTYFTIFVLSNWICLEVSGKVLLKMRQMHHKLKSYLYLNTPFEINVIQVLCFHQFQLLICIFMLILYCMHTILDGEKMNYHLLMFKNQKSLLMGKMAYCSRQS